MWSILIFVNLINKRMLYGEAVIFKMGLLNALKELWKNADIAYDTVQATTAPLEANVKISMSSAFDDAEYENMLEHHAANIRAITSDGLVEGIESNTMTPTETLFLWYIKDKPAKNPSIATYWTTTYCIEDFQAVIVRLCENGLLSANENYAFNASKCTVTELKAIAMDHEILATGKKAELVERILNNLSESEVSNLFSGIYFRLTDKGTALLENSKHLILFHQQRSHLDGDLTLEIVAILREESPRLDEYQLLINYHKRKALNDAKREECPPRNLVYCLATLFALKGDTVSSLRCLLIICYWDMSGAMYLPYIFDGKGIFDDENSPTKKADKVMARVEFSPAVVSSIGKYKSALSLEDGAFFDTYNSALLNIETVDAVYNKDEIFALLLTALSNFNANCL